MLLQETQLSIVNTKLPKIVWILINYGTDDEALKLVHNISRLAFGIQLNVIVVDNTQRSDSTLFFEQARAEIKDLICLKPDHNLGYFNGAHFALSKYLETNDYPEWIIVSNVDLQIRDSQFFRQLLKINLANTGIIAPRIWSDYHQRDDNPYMVSRISLRRLKFYRLINSNIVLGNAYTLASLFNSKAKEFSKHIYSAIVRERLALSIAQNETINKEVDEAQKIYAPHGACIIFSKTYFERGGTLNYPAFLFAEELYIAETSLSLGLSIIYRPDLVIYHKHHVSTGLFRSYKKNHYLYTSIDFIINRYFNLKLQ